MRAFALQPELLHKMPIDSALSELTAQLKKIEAADGDLHHRKLAWVKAAERLLESESNFSAVMPKRCHVTEKQMAVHKAVLDKSSTLETSCDESTGLHQDQLFDLQANRPPSQQPRASADDVNITCDELLPPKLDKSMKPGESFNIREPWIGSNVGTPSLQSRFSTPTLFCYSSVQQGQGKLMKTRMSRGFSDDANPPAICILFPTGRRKVMWSFIGVLLIMYDVIMMPLSAFSLERNIAMKIVEYVCASFWGMDIVVTFRTAFFVGPHLETRGSLIAANYAKTWLCADLIMVATDILGLVENIIVGSSVVRSTRALRVVRSLRILRLVKIQAFLLQVEEHVNSNVLILVFTLFRMIFLLLIAVHTSSCGWYAIGESSPNGWTAHFTTESHGFIFWYFASSRWMLAQLNGKTDTDVDRTAVEMAYTCVVAIIFAVVVMAVFISNITKTLMEIATISEGKTRMHRLVQVYLKNHGVHGEIASKVRHHVAEAVQENRQKEWDIESKVVKLLPLQLQKELLYVIRSPILKVHPLFNHTKKDAPQAMRQICYRAVHPALVQRGEIVFDAGDACHQMFFIAAGHFRYMRERTSPGSSFEDLTNDVMHVETLGKGMWICEPSLWVQWINQGQLESASESVLLEIEADDFAKAIDHYKEAKDIAAEYCQLFICALMQKEELSDIVEVLHN